MELNFVLRGLCVVMLLGLKVDGNCEIAVPEGCRCDLTGTTVRKILFKCNGNSFTSMPPQENYTYDGKIIGNFSYNLISTIPNFYFLNAKQYETLDFQSNRISGFNNLTFYGLTEMDVLNLSKNQISSIPSNSIEPLGRLEKLDLSDNSISSICGVKMKYVRTLSLSGNDITRLTERCFGYDSKVALLDLSRNEINVIHTEALTGMASLEDLNLDSNRLSTIGTALDSLRGSETLKRLSLRGNGINDLRDMCKYIWNNIEYLDFGHNDLNGITDYCFNGYGSSPGTTMELVVEHNNLVVITDRHLSGLENRLTSLRLNNNKITTIHYWSFKHMAKLVKLNIASNQLSKLTFFEEWTDNVLESLDLSENRLSHLKPGVFEHLTFLKELNLDGNLLFYIEANTFSGLEALEMLSINKNRLTDTADEAFKGVEPLKRLHLNGNSLVTLKNCTFWPLQSLEQFYFMDNLINCDCDLFWLPAFLNSITTRVVSMTDAKPIVPDQCHYPAKWKGNLLVNMVHENCAAATPKACLGLKLSLSGGNVTWSWTQSGSGATVTSYSQINAETGEVVDTAPLNSGESMFKLNQLEGESIYKICVNATQGNLKQTQCVIWPQEIIKPTPPPSTESATEKPAGMSVGDGAAVALAVILIIIIILLVLIGVYLYKTRKYKLLIPDRFSRASNSDGTESSQASPDTNGKSQSIDYRPGEEEPMMDRPPYTEHDL